MADERITTKTVPAETCPTHKIRMYTQDCTRCGGEGQIETDDDLLFPRGSFERCYSCAGSGQTPYTTCELCVEDSDDE